jgi:hypothetical protein
VLVPAEVEEEDIRTTQRGGRARQRRATATSSPRGEGRRSETGMEMTELRGFQEKSRTVQCILNSIMHLKTDHRARDAEITVDIVSQSCAVIFAAFVRAVAAHVIEQSRWKVQRVVSSCIVLMSACHRPTSWPRSLLARRFAHASASRRRESPGVSASVLRQIIDSRFCSMNLR